MKKERKKKIKKKGRKGCCCWFLGHLLQRIYLSVAPAGPLSPPPIVVIVISPLLP
jgi:hypothetical protein